MSKIKVKDFLKSLIAEKGMSYEDLSQKIGKSKQNIAVTIGYSNMSMKTFFQYMQGLGEEVTIVLKNGNKYNLDLSSKEEVVTNK